MRCTGASPVSVGGFSNIRSIWAVLQQPKWSPGAPGPLPASFHLRITINDPTISTFFRSQKQDGTFRGPQSVRGSRWTGGPAPPPQALGSGRLDDKSTDLRFSVERISPEVLVSLLRFSRARASDSGSCKSSAASSRLLIIGRFMSGSVLWCSVLRACICSVKQDVRMSTLLYRRVPALFQGCFCLPGFCSRH